MNKNPCQCGCGQQATFGKRFIKGHNGKPSAGKRSAYHAPRSFEGSEIKILPCLRCNQKFRSEGNHNRMCDRCRDYFNHEPTPETTFSFVRPKI